MVRVFDAHPVGAFIADPRGRVLRANAQLANMLGWSSPEALVGTEAGDHVDPQDRERVRPHWMGLLDGVTSDGRWRQRLVRADGSSFWARIQAGAARDPDGGLDFVVVTVEDIDRRHREQLRQQQVQRSLDHLFESTPAALAFIGLDHRPLRTNRAFQELLDCSSEELMHSALDSFVHPADQELLDSMFDRLEAGELAVDQHLRLIGKDGELKLTYARSIMLHDDEGHPLHVQSVLTNVTEQERARLQLESALDKSRQAAAQLEEASQAQARFVSMVSHEFRTALTSIQGFSELMRDAELGTSEVRDYASDINHEAQRLSRLINDLLDLDRLEMGRIQVQAVEMDLAQAVREQCARTDLGERALELQLPPGLPVVADPDRIAQVLANLLSNAVKYSPPEGVIRIEVRAEGDVAEVSVTDQGEGIPDYALEAVFDRYTRLSDIGSSSPAIKGSGLGLAIVREIVTRHGGRVWVESVLGQGSTFRFTLPLAPS